MTLLKVSHISKVGEGGFAMRDICFTQSRLQKIAIAGETGSGKSTLLKIIAGLIQPDNGDVWLDKKRVEGPSEKLVPGHRAIAYLSQFFELQKFLTVEQILGYANKLTEREANELYKICQIDHLLKRKTDHLSGGERQRIALARLLTSSPKLLLLDEPFSHLDLAHKNVLKSVINNISEKLEITCILVSHDPADTLSWADKIIVMKEGRIIQEGTPEKIYRQPVNDYVAGLFGRYTILSSAPKKTLFEGAKKFKEKSFYRSEDFKITEKARGSLKGKVISVTFFGGYYEVEISVLKSTIAVKTTERNIKFGDKVYVSLI